METRWKPVEASNYISRSWRFHHKTNGTPMNPTIGQRENIRRNADPPFRWDPSPLNGLPPPSASTPFPSPPPPLHPEGLQDFQSTKGPRNSGYFLDTLPDPNDAINRPFSVEICRGMKARWDDRRGERGRRRSASRGRKKE